jgi:gluconolactonase
MRRRTCLFSLAATTSAAWVAPFPVRRAVAAGIADRYAKITPGGHLGDLRTLATVEAPKVFTEGPCCDRAGHVFFTNTVAEHILRWDGRALSVFREQSGAANGLLFDREGRLLACEGGAGRVTRTDMHTGEVTVLVDAYAGQPLGAPNDLCLDGRGRIYFTSRFPTDEGRDGNVHAVYRIDPDGRTTRVVAFPDIHMPNGLVISPDDRTLYLIESNPRAERNRCILAFDLSAEGTLANVRTLIDFYPGRGGDGMAIDREGNLYVAAGLHATRKTSETLDTRPGIHVITPAGELIDFLQTPLDTVTNCRFGGDDLRTLYITCDRLLLSARSRVPGSPLYRPER